MMGLWRHQKNIFERLLPCINLLRLLTRFCHVTFLSFLFNLKHEPYLKFVVQGPLLDFGRNPILFPCAWLYRQGVLTPWTRKRFIFATTHLFFLQKACIPILPQDLLLCLFLVLWSSFGSETVGLVYICAFHWLKKNF